MDYSLIHSRTGATRRAKRIDWYLTSERKLDDMNESYHEKKREQYGLL